MMKGEDGTQPESPHLRMRTPHHKIVTPSPCHPVTPSPCHLDNPPPKQYHSPMLTPDILLNLRLLFNLLLATGLGALIGYERERAGKAAGMRTYGMVTLGACLFTIVSIYGFDTDGIEVGGMIIGRADPARVAAQIVPGIGFLGAGAILHRRGSIRGLTTAAALWVSAAIGLAVGANMVFLPLVASLLVYVLLHFGPHAGPPPAEEDEERAKKKKVKPAGPPPPPHTK